MHSLIAHMQAHTYTFSLKLVRICSALTIHRPIFPCSRAVQYGYNESAGTYLSLYCVCNSWEISGHTW